MWVSAGGTVFLEKKHIEEIQRLGMGIVHFKNEIIGDKELIDKNLIKKLKEDQVINEYLSIYKCNPIYVTNILQFIIELLRFNSGRAMLVDNIYLRKIARMLGRTSFLINEIKEISEQFFAIYEELSILNKKGIPCYMFNRVELLNRSFYTRDARKRIFWRLSFTKMYANQEKYTKEFKKLLGNTWSEEYVKKLGVIPQVVKKGRVYAHEDISSQLVNVVGGKRVVVNVPEKVERSIHVFGRCGVFGYAVEDADTLPSYLQRKFNADGYTGVEVINHGLWGGEDRLINHNFIMEEENIKAGDAVVFYMRRFNSRELEYYQRVGLQYYDITKEFHVNEISKWCFYDKPGHMTKEGYSLVADIIYKYMLEGWDMTKGEDEITSVGCIKRYKQYKKENDNNVFMCSLRRYLDELKKEYPLTSSQAKVGAIIMNCNPFTLGHRYLIEYASKQVDYLFVFVLEEDKSYFKFKDRFSLVKQGTDDLENVYVLASKEFMISTMTFPEYFMKDYVQEKEIDVTKDLTIFGEYIAPALGISKRFVGEEPSDLVTKQYNESMKKILPQYGIELIEIPRLCLEGDNFVSASKVRKLMIESRYEEIQKYVPQTTYNFLKENYFITNTSEKETKDFKEYVELNNHYRLPLGKGFGTFPNKESLLDVIPQAYEAGFRVFDTSDNYSNEEFVGKAIKENLHKEEQEKIIVITKFSGATRASKFEEIFANSYKKLAINKEHVIDIYLLHWPYPFLYPFLWKKIEQKYKEGYCKAIGVCNFEVEHLEKLKKTCSIMPMINQIECHPMFRQKEICDYCERNNIRIMSYSPLARMNEKLFANDILKKIATKYEKSIAQVILRWNYQNNYLALPSSNSRDHIQHNADIFDFTLTQDEMLAINSLDCGMRVRFDPKKRFTLLEKAVFLKERVLISLKD